ncbi:ABC transporter ATP-binding protein [Chloroflexota bacterium]
MTVPVLLRMENITKRFPGVVANDCVDFEVESGEVHALLGENGAGKTTLMNVLYGLYAADSGSITVRGERANLASPSAAIAHGIGMVHQHFMLIPAFTVAENIVLGTRLPKEPLLDLRRVEGTVTALSEQHGLSVDPCAVIGDLPVGVRQRVEIVKALYREADLLILDEPTAVLTPGEVRDLFKVLRNLTAQGKSIVFISHKLDEVMEISDRITVLRDGRVVSTVRREDTDKAALARMMVGREVVFRVSRDVHHAVEHQVLEVSGLTVGSDHDLPALSDVSLGVKGGEILAIAGVDGNGQRELAAVVSGLLRPTGGEVRIEGQDITNLGAKEIAALGVARIPEDRHELGLVMDFTVEENLILDSFDRPPNSRFSFLNRRAVRKRSLDLGEQYDIRPNKPDMIVRLMSGGNQQKVILARELSREPSFILAFQPTRGLDVGATEYVYRSLLEQRDRGAAILLISTELEEILMLADRIAVIYEGRIMGVVENEDADVERIGLMMAGSLEVESAPASEIAISEDPGS